MVSLLDEYSLQTKVYLVIKVNEGKDVFLFKKEDEVEYIPHFPLNLQVRWNKWGQGGCVSTYSSNGVRNTQNEHLNNVLV